jgi:hypothetical protein
LVRFQPPESRGPHLIVDPCAGDAEAITGLRAFWFGASRSLKRHNATDAYLYVVELERERFKAAEQRLALRDAYSNAWDRALNADAFRVNIELADGASLLFLNPPYGTDPLHKRTEQRFLLRWTECLLPGDGVLMFLVPHYALSASALFLACHYTDIRAWRFPDADFSNFQQCVLLARRRASPLPQNDLDRRRIEGWAKAPASLSQLEALAPPALTIRGGRPGLTLQELSLDLGALTEGFRPWDNSQAFGTHRSVSELIGSPYQVAMPPKPAHIALALSAGMLNGKRLTPNQPGLPPILLKGSFHRDFVLSEEKYDKQGDFIGSIQVQRPKLTLTALRLDTLQFQQLLPGTVPSGTTRFAEFNTADLVAAYGDALRLLMREQFPAVHDPSNPTHQMNLPRFARQPFAIQRHLITAGLKLIASGENPFVTAEVGTGKSTVSLSIAGALAPEHFAQTRSELTRLGFATSRLRPVRRILILCPPHLLKNWRDQSAAVLPTHRVQIVEEISDLRSPAEIYILSRETAKLGHGVRGLDPLAAHTVGRRQCPKCGRLVNAPADGLATRRERCGYQQRRPTNAAARLAENLALALLNSYPFDPTVRSLLVNRNGVQLTLERNELDEDNVPPAGPPPSQEKIDSIARQALRLLCLPRQEYLYETNRVRRTIALLAKGAASAANVIQEARTASAQLDQQALQAGDQGFGPYSDEVAKPRQLASEMAALAQSLERQGSGEPPHDQPLPAALEEITACGTWEEGPPCPEPLFQAIPNPRRYPIARLLLRWRRHLACNPDLLILDEAHEYSNGGSAQGKAAHRLVEIPGIPTIALSGSFMGGYAGSLFANFWAMSPRFRRVFRRTEKGSFVTRYGYRKFFVPAGQEAQTEVIGYGTRSDREDRRDPMAVRQLSEAPGILPLFILEHLLPVALIMHKADLEAELPPYRELPVPIEVLEGDTLGKQMLAEHERLLRALMKQIKADMYSKHAGKLWGAMSTLPSYLERCLDDLPPFVLKYPDPIGGAVVAQGKLFPSTWLTPKERWMLDRVKRYLREGRNVLIFLLNSGRSGLPARYLRLFEEHLGQPATFLDVKKVKAADREEWLNSQVIQPGCRILITNPKAVQTGLNNLVAFSRAIWIQGLDYDARVVRQANGRIHRIGQLLDVTIDVPFYAGTVQKVALDLVAQKISASVQVDGLSIEGALEGAGAGDLGDEAHHATLSIGRAIYEAWQGQ